MEASENLSAVTVAAVDECYYSIHTSTDVIEFDMYLSLSAFSHGCPDSKMIFTTEVMSFSVLPVLYLLYRLNSLVDGFVIEYRFTVLKFIIKHKHL